MSAMHSMETARTEDMTAKPVFRGCRAIVAAATVIACGLLAAPLQAEHQTIDVTMTLTATAGNTYVTLAASHTGALNVHYQYREETEDIWRHMADTAQVWDLTNGVPYTFEGRALQLVGENDDGSDHFIYSDVSESVTVTPSASAGDPPREAPVSE